MIIVVHTSEDAPAHLRAIAHFLVGKHLLPVRVTASDAETARIKAQEFWDSEKARWLKRLNPDKPLKSIEAEHTPTEPVPPPVAPPTERQTWLGLVADTADAADGLPERETPPIDEAVVAEIKREEKVEIAAPKEQPKPKKRVTDLDDLL